MERKPESDDKLNGYNLTLEWRGLENRSNAGHT